MRCFESLKENYDFRRLYRSKTSFVTSSLVLYSSRGRRGKIRLGITVSKKLGGAVERNRAKRIVRAAFDMCAENIKEGTDFVIVARKKMLKMKSNEVAAVLKRELAFAGLWSEKNEACQ